MWKTQKPKSTVTYHEQCSAVTCLGAYTHISAVREKQLGTTRCPVINITHTTSTFTTSKTSTPNTHVHNGQNVYGMVNRKKVTENTYALHRKLKNSNWHL